MTIYTPEGVIVTNSRTIAALTIEPTARPKAAQPTDKEKEVYYPWGADNNFPDLADELIERSSIISPVLDLQARLLYGSGLQFGRWEGNEWVEVPETPELKDFKYSLKRSKYLYKACHAFYRYFNVFPSLVLSTDRKRIVQVVCSPTTQCRLSRRNKEGVSEKLYLQHSWASGYNKAAAIEKPVLDLAMLPDEQIRNGTAPEYIYPVQYPNSDKVYALAPWDAAIQSGWYAIARDIPAFKRAIFENQMTIKYLVRIDSRWWEWAFPGFKNFTAEERKAKMSEYLDKLEQEMTGTDKTFRSLTTTDFYDPHTGQVVKGWQIDVIDDKIGQGAYIEDGKEANQQLLYALGMDVAIMGGSPGNMLASGSGTDKEAAIKIYLNSRKMDMDLILEPINFALRYNGHNDVEARFLHNYTSTVNKGAQETKTID